MQTEEVQALFGFPPIDVIPAEHYVTQLWDALDQTVVHKRNLEEEKRGNS